MPDPHAVRQQSGFDTKLIQMVRSVKSAHRKYRFGGGFIEAVARNTSEPIPFEDPFYIPFSIAFYATDLVSYRTSICIFKRNFIFKLKKKVSKLSYKEITKLPGATRFLLGTQATQAMIRDANSRSYN